nr:transposase [Mesorhizobium atlanticum]
MARPAQNHHAKRLFTRNIVQRIVERTFAWLDRCRRLAKDFEATIASAEAWIIASIRLMLRRVAAPRPA